MKRHSRISALLVSAALLILSACSTTASETADPSTIELQADYPSYDERSLVEEATLIVEGTVLATESTVVKPRYEGDTPEENPLVGLSEEEKKKIIEQDDGVAATAVTFRVDVVHQGDVESGQKITILQTGGVVDGVTYQVAGEAMLSVKESYLLFATSSFDGAFVSLGGSAGTYRSSGDGNFTAVNPETAPFKELSAAEVASLDE